MVGELADARYISLTTFRRDGTEASTPVWVASDDGVRLLVWTGGSTWKAKRIRNDPRVLVARSNYKGKERGPRLEGRARIVDDVDINGIVRRKYPVQKRMLELLARGKPDRSVAIEIRDA
jgi:uncharacterized protein